MTVIQEIPPIQSKDFFKIVRTTDSKIGDQLHFHRAYEISLVVGGSGKRIIGDKIDTYQDSDMVLLGPNLKHRWDITSSCQVSTNINRTIIHFTEDSLSPLIAKEVFYPIKIMLQHASRGVEFLGNTKEKAAQIIQNISITNTFEASLEFLKVLHLLATTKEKRFIASPGYSSKIIPQINQRIDKVYEYIQHNFHQPITVKEVAKLANMSTSAFSHYFKKSTNQSFIRFLTEVRLGKACELLCSTSLGISEIANKTGYANISNFNRLFKKYKGCTPIEFRNKITYSIMDYKEQP